MATAAEVRWVSVLNKLRRQTAERFDNEPDAIKGEWTLSVVKDDWGAHEATGDLSFRLFFTANHPTLWNHACYYIPVIMKETEDWDALALTAAFDKWHDMMNDEGIESGSGIR